MCWIVGYTRGVDFFIAGVERGYRDGGVVGVHSWSDGRVEGADLPVDAPVHDFIWTIIRTWASQRILLVYPQCDYDSMK